MTRINGGRGNWRKGVGGARLRVKGQNSFYLGFVICLGFHWSVCFCGFFFQLDWFHFLARLINHLELAVILASVIYTREKICWLGVVDIELHSDMHMDAILKLSTYNEEVC